LVLLAATAPQPGCGPAIEPLLTDLNRARLASGASALHTHPALCATAAERLEVIAREGFADQDVGAINRRTRSLYRKGYAAHAWSEAAIVGGGEEALLEQFRAVRPDWYQEALTGDFEEVGAALSQLDGRPVCAILLALPRRSVEWRQAEPLRDLDQVRTEILAAVNDIRADAGHPPLRLAPRLTAAAQAHAEDMLRRAYFDHISPEGAGPGARARAAGYDPARAIAENIAKGPFTPAEVVERWLNSSGHRRNILRPGAVEMGAGVAFGENANGFEVVWVQLFGGG
jgi:uncharacterized protein YkwD